MFFMQNKFFQGQQAIYLINYKKYINKNECLYVKIITLHV